MHLERSCQLLSPELEAQLSPRARVLAPPPVAEFRLPARFAIRDVREKHGAEAAAEVQMSLAFTVNALFYCAPKPSAVSIVLALVMTP